ncbi:MAG: NusG domain II-containing protein [Magnetococcus sp. DMHC-6]
MKIAPPWRVAMALLKRATTPADRWLALFLALAIVALGWLTKQPAGATVTVFVNNRAVKTLNLFQKQSIQVDGRLGPVTIETGDGHARLLEYQSPRLIGTRTGWIQSAGAIAACVPCRVVIQINTAPTTTPEYDAIAQ